MKRLIINADDFGYSKGINRGIIEAYEKGILTSTSLMVNAPAAKEAASLLKNYPTLGVGLHFVLTDAKGKMLRSSEIASGIVFVENVGKELQSQLEEFQKLTGEMPDHIDGHYHVHLLSKIYPYFARVAKELNVPLRAKGKVNFIAEFYGRRVVAGPGSDELERISVGHLLDILGRLPEGISEIMCHPGYATPDSRSSYSFQREIELKTLTDPRIKEFIEKEGIQLINFSQI